MSIVRVGTFPASSINVGLGSAVAGLNAKASKLSADVTSFQSALTTQLQFSANFPPNIVGYATGFAASLNPAVLVSAFNPANWVTLNAGANAGLVADLAFIEAQIGIVEPLAASLRAGLDAGNLAGWSYAGRSSGFGNGLRAQTLNGFGGIGPRENIDALIIATSAFSSWQSFSEGVDTDGTADEDLGGATTQERLRFLGRRTGSQWSIGLSAAMVPIDALLLELRGTKIAIENQIEVSLGIGLPAPDVIVDAGISVDLDAVLAGMVDVQADIGADISGFQAQIDLNASLIADISAQLSAGGLTFWSYSGPAGEIGSSFVPEVSEGLPGVSDGPNGAAYGIVIATQSPTAWASFGNIFKTS